MHAGPRSNSEHLQTFALAIVWVNEWSCLHCSQSSSWFDAQMLLNRCCDDDTKYTFDSAVDIFEAPCLHLEHEAGQFLCTALAIGIFCHSGAQEPPFIQRLVNDPCLQHIKLIAEPWDCAWPDGPLGSVLKMVNWFGCDTNGKATKKEVDRCCIVIYSDGTAHIYIYRIQYLRNI